MDYNMLSKKPWVPQHNGIRPQISLFNFLSQIELALEILTLMA